MGAKIPLGGTRCSGGGSLTRTAESLAKSARSPYQLPEGGLMIGERSRGLAYLMGAPLAAIIFGLAGCFPSPKPKAASTLKCPEAQLAVEDNSTGAQVVTGCG